MKKTAVKSCRTSLFELPSCQRDLCRHEWNHMATRPSGMPGKDANKNLKIEWCWICGSLAMEDIDGTFIIVSPRRLK